MLTRATTDMTDHQSLSTTRRRAVISPTMIDPSDKDNLLQHHSSTEDENSDNKDVSWEDDNLTLMEQVVLMGIKDQQVSKEWTIVV